MVEVGIVDLEEVDGLEEVRGKDGFYMEDSVVVVEIVEYLGVYRLEGIGVKDCFVRVCVNVEGVIRFVFEMLVFVVVGENWLGY